MAARAMSVTSLWVATVILLVLWIFLRPGGAEPTYADILLGVVLVLQVLISIIDHIARPSDHNDDEFAQRSRQFPKKNR